MQQRADMLKKYFSVYISWTEETAVYHISCTYSLLMLPSSDEQ